MIDTSPKAFWDELEASRRQQEDRLFMLDEMVGRYHGPAWDRSAKDRSDPENPGFEWIATMKNNFIAGDPRVATKATRVDRPKARQKAIGLRHTINRIARDGDHKRFWRKQFPDWCFGYSAFCIQRSPAPWADRGPLDGPPMRPRLARISPKRLRYDARATEWTETRWRGFELVVSKSAALEWAKKERGWRVKEIEAIQPDSGDLREMFPTGGDRVTRDDFKLYVVWVPEESLRSEPGFNGAMHFYAETAASVPLVEIRDPQPYYGPRQGPIYMSGQETVPDSAHPLSVMSAIENLARELGLQAKVVSAAQANYKKILVVRGGTKAGEVIKAAKHQSVVEIGGFEHTWAQEYSLGGLDADQLAAYQFLLERIDRRSGLSATARGQAAAGTTATAEAIAQGGATARTEGLRDEYYAHMRDGYRGIGEIVCMDEEVYYPLDERAVQEMVEAGADPEQIPTYVQGGYEDGETFEDYEIEIEPMSLRHRSQEEREMAAEREMLMWTQLAAVIPTSPFFAWPSILSDLGDAWQRPELPERLNVKMAEQIAGLMLAMNMQGAAYQDNAPKTQPTTQPRKASAIDITGSSRPAGQSAARPTPQIGMGTAGASVQRRGTAGNRAGARAGAKATQKTKQKAGAR